MVGVFRLPHSTVMTSALTSVDTRAYRVKSVFPGTRQLVSIPSRLSQSRALTVISSTLPSAAYVAQEGGQGEALFVAQRANAEHHWPTRMSGPAIHDKLASPVR